MQLYYVAMWSVSDGGSRRATSWCWGEGDCVFKEVAYGLYHSDVIE